LLTFFFIDLELDMNLKYLVVVVALVAISAAQPLSAHHSVPVNFDTSREATINGVLTEIKWVNPHAHWRLNVTQPDGTILEWLVEFGAANTMKRAGFPMEQFMIGDKYTVIGSPGRRDRSILLEEVIFPDGTRMTPSMRPRDPSNRN
jgi:hypothetical protein